MGWSLSGKIRLSLADVEKLLIRGSLIKIDIMQSKY